MRQTGEQQVFSGPENDVIEGALLWACCHPDFILVGSNVGEEHFCRAHVPQMPFLVVEKHQVLQISGSQSAVVMKATSEDLPLRCPSQPSVRPKLEQMIFKD